MEKIIENNVLIAEFMGYKPLNKTQSRGLLAPELLLVAPNGYYINKEHELLYDSSWDSLMPVWFKILKWGKNEYGLNWEQSIGETFITVNIHKGTFKINWMNTGDIRDVWYVVVAFIKWLKKQKNDEVN